MIKYLKKLIFGEPKFKLGPIQTKWLQSLEAHPERQLKHRLGIKKSSDDTSYQACCLGELGLIAGVCQWEGINLSTKKFSERGVLLGVYKELGLYSPHGDKKTFANHLVSRELSLAELNDSGTTWPEIAAIVRANPEGYFSKSF